MEGEAEELVFAGGSFVRLLVLLFCSIAAIGQSTSPTPESKPQAKTTDQKSRPDFGLGSGARGRQLGAVDILSDTQGVDFGPYLQRSVQVVRQNWYLLIPESAQMKKGKLAIEFAITKDGQVADMRLVSSSGDVMLDRPAWGSITNSNPFKPLPTEFKGPYLALRFRYFYNPDKSDLEPGGPPTSGKGNTGGSSTKSKSGIIVSVSAPGSLQVPAGGSQVVTATVTGTEEKVVEWTITGSGCSGSACGKMAGDLYVAPNTVPSLPDVTLTASAKADPTAKASVTLRIVQPH
jgi:TonB family protein